VAFAELPGELKVPSQEDVPPQALGPAFRARLRLLPGISPDATMQAWEKSSKMMCHG
jgi:hypothetical protein